MSTTWAPGDLHLFFITADVSESTDLIGKCDPYIVFGWTDEPDTKLTKKNSTKTKVNFVVPHQDGAVLRVELWDQNVLMSDELIGVATLTQAEVAKFYKEDVACTHKFEFTKKDKKTGKMITDVTYTTKAWRDERAAQAMAEKEDMAKWQQELVLSSEKLSSKVDDKFVSDMLKTFREMDIKSIDDVQTLLVVDTKCNLFAKVGLLSVANMTKNHTLVKDSVNDPEYRPYIASLVFEMFDLDNSGSLSFEELVLGVMTFCSYNAMDKASMYFDIMDKDKSGTLSFAEIEDLYVKSYKSRVLLSFSLYRNGVQNKSHLSFADKEKHVDHLRSLFNEFNSGKALATGLFKLLNKNIETDHITREEYLNTVGAYTPAWKNVQVSVDKSSNEMVTAAEAYYKTIK